MVANPVSRGSKRLARLRATLTNPVRRKRRRNQYWRHKS